MEDYAMLELAILGNNIRNIVFGGFILFYAFNDTKTLVILLAMRLAIEFLALTGEFVLNSNVMDLIPLFALILTMEAFLIYAGRKSLRKAD